MQDSQGSILMSKELIKEYYSETALKEWRRLTRDPYHRLEFDTTMHFLRTYLPKGGLILDAGGGPGRYTIELARMGYDIVLLDVTPELLELARKQVKKAKVDDSIKEISEGSIVDLSRFRDRTFDSVVCLGGALSHIVNRKKRDKAIDELIRVTKRGAPIFVSVIARIGLLISALIYFPQEIEIDRVFKRIRDKGDYLGGYGFAPCHFYLADELRDSFKKTRVKVLEIVGLEGLAAGHRKETNRLFKKHPEAWKRWWETHLRTCTHPAAVGVSEHFLMICRKL
ncbi:MAG: class I SAM-dependent methyltransferase [Thermoplasmata archaeon]